MLRSRGKTSATTRRWTTSPIATESSRARASRFAPSRTGSARPRTSTRRRRCWRPSPRMTVRAPIALRVNPDVDPQTHPYIATGLKTSKFGIPIAQAESAYAEAARLPGVQVVGAQMHIGSQLTKTSPFADATARLAALVRALRERGLDMRFVDVGGGLGIRYRD